MNFFKKSNKKPAYTPPPKFKAENYDRSAIKVTGGNQLSAQFGSGSSWKAPEVNPDTGEPYYTPPWTPD